MADPYRALSEREAERADAHADAATAAAGGAITRTLTRAATAAINNADTGGVDTLVNLRVATAAEKAAELAKAQARASAAILAALRAGYDYGAAQRAEIVAKQTGLAVTAGDAPDLAAAPVAGYTADELAASLRFRLGQDIDRALALPLTGTVPVGSVPAMLGQVAEQHAVRVGDAVREAYHAGARQSSVDLGDALGGDDDTPFTVGPGDGDSLPDGKRVWFQYHTQHDARVRPSHAALDGTVWRIDDESAPTPPIDWGCRCFMSYCSAPGGDDKLPDPVPPRDGSAAERSQHGTVKPVPRSGVYAAYLDQHVDGWRSTLEHAVKQPPAKRLSSIIDSLRADGMPSAQARDIGNMILAVYHG